MISFCHSANVCNVKTWARAGRISPRAVYDYMHGMTRPDAETLAAWFSSRLIPTEAKLHLLVVLTAGSGLEVRVGEARQMRIPFVPDVLGECVDVSGAGQHLLEVTRLAVADRRIDDVEAVAIRAAVAAVQVQAVEVAGLI